MRKAKRYIDNYKTDDDGIRWVRLDHVNSDIKEKNFIIEDLTKRIAFMVRTVGRGKK